MPCPIKPISYTRFRDSCSEELIKLKQLRRDHHNTVLTPSEWKTFHDYYTLHIAEIEQPLQAIKFFIYSVPAGPYKSDSWTVQNLHNYTTCFYQLQNTNQKYYLSYRLFMKTLKNQYSTPTALAKFLSLSNDLREQLYELYLQFLVDPIPTFSFLNTAVRDFKQSEYIRISLNNRFSNSTTPPLPINFPEHPVTKQSNTIRKWVEDSIHRSLQPNNVITRLHFTNLLESELNFTSPSRTPLCDFIREELRLFNSAEQYCPLSACEDLIRNIQCVKLGTGTPLSFSFPTAYAQLPFLFALTLRPLPFYSSSLSLPSTSSSSVSSTVQPVHATAELVLDLFIKYRRNYSEF